MISHILLVDDNEDFRRAIERSLVTAGHKVTCAENGRQALVYYQTDHSINLIISDIRMPEMDGLAFLKSIRNRNQVPTRPRVAFILMTGFSEIIEVQHAYELGADHFLPKPFSRNDLLELVKNPYRSEPKLTLIQGQEQKQDQVQEKEASSGPSEGYCQVDIDEFLFGDQIKFNIFVKLSESKYIKIAHQGQDLEADRISNFKHKGVNYLYLKQEDFKNYVGFGFRVNRFNSQQPGTHRDKKLKLLRQTNDILQHQIPKDGLNLENYNSARIFIESTMDVITEYAQATELLYLLSQYAEHVFVHSVGVSLYSVMMTKFLALQVPSIRFKIAVGALFHDIGEKELGPDLLDKNRGNWSDDDTKEYESHPNRGVRILSELEFIPTEVLEIVHQHHENCQSRGFPTKLNQTNIHPMAKLVSVADEFCHRVIKGPQSQAMTPNTALNDMFNHCHQSLDKQCFLALTDLYNFQADILSSRKVQ